ncbi:MULTISPECIES: hypothetical protein [Sphingomonas]|uniref:hypothetical protein n=1 Tax=Sphingomonas TaxID=13687 RepID=UPI000DEEDDCF|nr:MULTISPECIES: hypothetical protein [Sphingomonas]
MSDFEALFSLFGVVFGLIVAEIALKFADAIDGSRARPLGALTPALALLILTDITNFWMFLWGSRAALVISWHLVFTGVMLAIVYFLAASLAFPRTKSHVAHLDEHYWHRKQIVAGGILFVNIIVIGALVARTAPAWNDWWFYFYFPSYVVALAGLTFSKSRRFDLLCLGWALFVNLSAGSDLLPHSQFGKITGQVPQHQQ